MKEIVDNIKEVAKFGLTYDVDSVYMLELILDIANGEEKGICFTEEYLAHLYLDD